MLTRNIKKGERLFFFRDGIFKEVIAKHAIIIEPSPEVYPCGISVSLDKSTHIHARAAELFEAVEEIKEQVQILLQSRREGVKRLEVILLEMDSRECESNLSESPMWQCKRCKMGVASVDSLGNCLTCQEALQQQKECLQTEWTEMYGDS